jgi:uncharacterized protein (DUF2062 family)
MAARKSSQAALLKKFFQKYSPDAQSVRSNRLVAKLGPRLTDPNLWHLNRRSVSAGVFAGIFSAFMPPGLQLMLAIPLAMAIRGNLAVAFASTWVTNPFTYLPVYFACYRLGLWLMGENADISDAEFNLDHLAANLWDVGQPLLLGCSVSAVFFGVLCYGLVRLLWRLSVISHIRQRALRRKKKAP